MPWSEGQGGRPATSRWSNCHHIWKGGEGCSHPPAGRLDGSGSEKGGPTTNALWDLPVLALFGNICPKDQEPFIRSVTLEWQQSRPGYRAASSARPKAKRAADLPELSESPEARPAGRKVADSPHWTKTFPTLKRRDQCPHQNGEQHNFSVAVLVSLFDTCFP